MISDKPFDITSGDKNVFQSDLPIKSESFCRVFIDTTGTGTWDIIDESLYQVIMDSVVFTVAPTGTYLVLQVATVITELLNSPTDISMVLAMRDEIKEIGTNISVIQVVGDNMNEILEVKDNLPSIIIVNDNITAIKAVSNNINDINTYVNTYYFSLDVAPTILTHPTLTEGDLYFNNILKEVQVYDGSTWLRAYSGDIYTKGEVDDLNRRVPMKVKATEDINKGNVIMATGYNSGEDAINVTKTVNQTDIAVGIANINILNGGFGDVITRGLIEGVDMSGYNFGDILYSNGAGGFTTTKPTGAYQAIGFVLKNVSNGALMVDFTEPVDSYTKEETDILLGSGTGLLSTDNLLHIQHQEASGTNGGDTVAGEQVRPLNTVLINNITGASLSANKITLPIGTYYVEALGMTRVANNAKNLIYNSTDNVLLLVGFSSYTNTSYGLETLSPISGLITLTAQIDIDFRVDVASAKTTNGFGVQVGSGSVEVYGDMKIWKVA